MKLWEKGINPEPAIIEFTAGKDRKTDLHLTKWDIVGSMAHVIMLNDVGLILDEERNDMLKALHSLFVWDEEGSLVIEKDVEDIHSQIEKEMASILGMTGKKIHTGRSRNDQVLVDIRLYTREEIDKLAELMGRLFSRLQSLERTVQRCAAARLHAYAAGHGFIIRIMVRGIFRMSLRRPASSVRGKSIEQQESARHCGRLRHHTAIEQEAYI